MKELKLTPREWKLYSLLKNEPNKWWSKEEILNSITEYNSSRNETSHDICASLNLARLHLNAACSLGLVSHYTLIKDNAFKLANEDEMHAELKKMEKQMWRLYIRYLGAKGVLKENGQGKLIDCKGKVIDEDSLAKRFFEPFNFEE